MNATTSSHHAGLLIPLDMVRLSQVAATFADLLIGKARNILDAKLVVARHASSPLLLLKITGHVIGSDEAAFWRDNADLVGLASQILPRQVFMYYAEPGPPAQRREGFVIAQKGQVVAADEATSDRLPANATDADWPVARLCQQIRITVDDLVNEFPGGPRVEVPLAQPTVDDQALLTTLLATNPDTVDTAASPASPASPGAAPAASENPQATPAGRPGMDAAEDLKRRALETVAEAASQRVRADEVAAALRFAEDDTGIVVAPVASMSETEILAPFVVSAVQGDLPRGLPQDLTTRLQGRRVDVAVRVEFLSEVFVDNIPLSRAHLEKSAQPSAYNDGKLKQLAVLGPRLGHGTLLSTGTKHVFVSRKPGAPIPEEILAGLFER